MEPIDDQPLIVYFGHHKCATQWMKNLVRGIARRTGWTVHRYASPADFGHDLNSIGDRATSIVCYTNARMRYAREVRNLRGWHMVRDPRDIVVSSYFSHLKSHPAVVTAGSDEAPQEKNLKRIDDHRTRLEAMSKEEGLLHELDQRAEQFKQMAQWDYAQPNVLELRMEDVIAEPVRWLREITKFVGLYGTHGIDDDVLAAVADENAFSVLSGGRDPGQEDVESHYRKGIPGDWRHHFQPAHVERFKELYNPLLLQLGYETSPDWS